MRWARLFTHGRSGSRCSTRQLTPSANWPCEHIFADEPLPEMSAERQEKNVKYYLELSYPVATNDRDKCDAILRVAVGSPPADSGAGFHAEMGGTARDAGWYFRSRKAAEQVRDRLLHDPTLERISGLIIGEIEELDDDDDD